MALIFMDGFDKYGGTNTYTAEVAALLSSGDWTSAAGGSIVAPLSSTGQAFQYQNANIAVQKTFSTNYSRLIGGFRFNSNFTGTTNCGVAFWDGATSQCCIVVNGSGVGTISLRNGSVAGTVIATSASAIVSGSTHYLEFDITFGNAASYQVWLDGVSIFSGTGDTTATANNFANQFGFASQAGGGHVFIVDDVYLFDATGTVNNAPLLTSPRIETTFPVSDSAVQFAVGAGILGSSVPRILTTNGPSANSLNLRLFIPSSSCILNSISLMPSAAGGFPLANMRGVIYADSSGAPGALISSGPIIIGMVANVALTLPLTTPQSLVAGTRYWLGYMNDIVMGSSLLLLDTANAGVRATVTFTSGAPGTAPAMTAGQPTFLFWGNLTGIAVNYDEVNNQPPDNQYSYVFDTVVGHEDLYNFPPLSIFPANVHGVAVKGYFQKSDSGSKTVSLRMKSGATDGGGSLTGQPLAPGSFNWLSSYFELNPNGGVAWTGTSLNAAQSGFRIDS